jgi:lipoyl(octanoyl) transferase
VPCGIREFGVTSLAALGRTTDRERVDAALAAAFVEVFGGPLVPPERARAPAAVDFEAAQR